MKLLNPNLMVFAFLATGFAHAAEQEVEQQPQKPKFVIVGQVIGPRQTVTVFANQNANPAALALAARLAVAQAQHGYPLCPRNLDESELTQTDQQSIAQDEAQPAPSERAETKGAITERYETKRSASPAAHDDTMFFGWYEGISKKCVIL